MKLLVLFAFALLMESATAQHGASASNMTLLGHEPLQARSAYQPVIHTPAGERCRVAIQSNNVEVDDRGHIYVVDRANTGMHILQFNR